MLGRDNGIQTTKIQTHHEHCFNDDAPVSHYTNHNYIFNKIIHNLFELFKLKLLIKLYETRKQTISTIFAKSPI